LDSGEKRGSRYWVRTIIIYKDYFTEFFAKQKQKVKDKIIPIEVFGEESESVTIGYRLPGMQSPDNYKSLLVKEVLDNSVAGLIDLNINKKLLVLDASAYLDQNKDNNVLIITGYPKQNQTLEEVKDILMAQIDSLRFGKFDEKLISSAGFNLKVKNERSFADITSTAYSLLNSFTKEIPFGKKLTEPIQMMKTKKILITTIAILSCILRTQAQNVYIPDSIFKTALVNNANLTSLS
jgi:hypothetical protein